MQQWLAEPEVPGSRLVLLSRQAVPVRPGDPLRLDQASVPGLLRAAIAEHPDRLALIDTDGSMGLDVLAAAVAGGQRELAVRAGRLLLPRLVPEPDPGTDQASELPAALAGTVLITGGTGSLGASIARHLARRHPGIRLLLVSRRGEQAPGAPELAAELAGLGAAAELRACDVADPGQLAGLLGGLASPLTAVLHAAGLVRDAAVANLTEQALADVLRAKVRAGWQLHRQTSELPPAAFVLFGSVSGLLGTAGQANYAAANTFLDALAEHRRQAGLPAVCLDWGLWEDADGMASRLDATGLRRLRQAGLAPLPVEAGLRLLDRVLAVPAAGEPGQRDDAPAVLVPVLLDPLAVRRRQAGPDGNPWLDGISPRRPATAATTSPTAGTPAPVDQPGFAQQLAEAAEPDRYDLLIGLVRSAAAAALGHGAGELMAADRGFLDAGLDSLAAVQLRRTLAAQTGLQLAATIAFDFPTPAKLARYLCDRLAEQAPPPSERPAAEVAELVAELRRLGAEVARRLAGEERLAELAAELAGVLGGRGRPAVGSPADAPADFSTASDEELFRFLTSSEQPARSDYQMPDFSGGYHPHDGRQRPDEH